MYIPDCKYTNKRAILRDHTIHVNYIIYSKNGDKYLFSILGQLWLDLFIEEVLLVPVPNDHALDIQLAKTGVLAQLQSLGHNQNRDLIFLAQNIQMNEQYQGIKSC